MSVASSRLITPTFLGVMAAAFAFFMYVGVLVPIIPRFVENDMRGGELGIGLAIASFAGAAIVVRPLIGRLIERHGFTIVAVEADWPDAASIDRYVRHRPKREGEEAAFQRFPTWMWRNTDVEAFVRWLRGWNAERPYEAMAGFYGLDLYNLAASIRAVIDFLDEADPEAARVARERYGCLRPWAHDPAAYGLVAITEGYGRCEAGVVEMLRDLMTRRMDCLGEECDEWLDAAEEVR